jgi:hypothetical protein
MVVLQQESLNRFRDLLDGSRATEQASGADTRSPGVARGGEEADVTSWPRTAA